jgi:fatty acid desaturase
MDVRRITAHGAATVREWPTLLVAILIYSGWVAATLWHDRLPMWVLAPIGAWMVAWHGSLQHEVIHGHPTSSARLNALIAWLPISLWLPFGSYRREHIAHHATEQITHPIDDPESRYLANERGPVATLRRAGARLQSSLLGRLLVGPAFLVAGFMGSEVLRLRREPLIALRDWVPHLTGVVLIVTWLHYCGFSLVLYVFAFVYPGIALSLLRSFAEHRAADRPGHRVAIVEGGGLLALLFLNNNLHAAHHRAPGVPWFRLPAFYREHRASILTDNGGLLYRGYGEIFRRFWRRPHDVIIHPELA